MLPGYHMESLNIYLENLSFRNITDPQSFRIQLANLPQFLVLVGKYEYTWDQMQVIHRVIRQFASKLVKDGIEERVTLNWYSYMLRGDGGVVE